MNNHSDSKKAGKQSVFLSAGIDVNEVGAPFWKPDTRERTITVLAVRPGMKKQLPEGKGELTVLAVLDIQVAGADHVWEVSSKRALVALDAAMTTLPADIVVQAHGKGTDTTFTIKPAPPKLAKGKLAAPCDAPGCVSEMGHHGRHSTQPAEASA